MQLELQALHCRVPPTYSPSILPIPVNEFLVRQRIRKLQHIISFATLLPAFLS